MGQNRRWTDWVKAGIVLATVLLAAAGCRNAGEEQKDLFRYKGSYIGDNSAVINILHGVPGGGHVGPIELKTAEPPCGLIVQWKEPSDSEGEMQLSFRESAVYQAAFIFALVQNADWITVRTEGREFTVTREQFRDMVGADVATFTSEAELLDFVASFLKNENPDQAHAE